MDQALGSLIRCAPSRSLGSQTRNGAPAGSASTAIRPAGGASSGPAITAPPSLRAFSAASSALSTDTYVFQTGAGGPLSAGSELIPATSRPATRATKYSPPSGIGPGPANSQPNT